MKRIEKHLGFEFTLWLNFFVLFAVVGIIGLIFNIEWLTVGSVSSIFGSGLALTLWYLPNIIKKLFTNK